MIHNPRKQKENEQYHGINNTSRFVAPNIKIKVCRLTHFQAVKKIPKEISVQGNTENVHQEGSNSERRKKKRRKKKEGERKSTRRFWWYSPMCLNLEGMYNGLCSS